MRWVYVVENAATQAVSSRCKDRASDVEGLEKALDLWATQMEAKGQILTDDVLLVKAKEIGSKLTDLPANFNYSNKCVSKWKKFHGFRLHQLHGEAGGADPENVHIGRTQVPDRNRIINLPL